MSKQGYWITEETNGWESRVVKCNCSECDGKALMESVSSMDGYSLKFVLSNFCSHCGAEMSLPKKVNHIWR